LIPSLPPATSAVATEVPIDAIEPNPFQPRATMDPDELDALTASIRVHGVIQPLVVAPGADEGRYTLIAGERRWRAARLAGLDAVPVVVKDVAPRDMLELALVENVVRSDLSPLEEAAAYRQLVEDFELTHAVVAERVGRSRVSITNTLRLLAAPAGIQAALTDGRISEGHARALLGLGAAPDQLALLADVIARDLTVRQTEAAVRRWLARDEVGPQTTGSRADPDRSRLEDRFRSAFGTKVNFQPRRGGGGRLTIHYTSDDELDALYRRVVGEDTW